VRTVAPGDRAVLSRISRTYLDGWKEYESPERLAEAARLAAVPAIVSRALMWRDAVIGIDGETRLRYEGTVAEHLRALLRQPSH
jgi:hypothetical protein